MPLQKYRVYRVSAVRRPCVWLCTCCGATSARLWHWGQAIIDLRRGIRYCKVCHNISETEECAICGSPVRDHSTVCVVENVRDVMSFEATGQFRGCTMCLAA